MILTYVGRSKTVYDKIKSLNVSHGIFVQKLFWILANFDGLFKLIPKFFTEGSTEKRCHLKIEVNLSRELQVNMTFFTVEITLYLQLFLVI